MKRDFHGAFWFHEVNKPTSDYPAEFGWRDLFHKLVLEQFLNYFNKQSNNKGPLKNLHIYLNALASEISVLRVAALDNQRRLKSKNYWLMVVLGKLTKLRVLKLHLEFPD
jgi:hypothetical protein